MTNSWPDDRRRCLKKRMNIQTSRPECPGNEGGRARKSCRGSLATRPTSCLLHSPPLVSVFPTVPGYQDSTRNYVTQPKLPSDFLYMYVSLFSRNCAACKWHGHTHAPLRAGQKIGLAGFFFKWSRHVKEPFMWSAAGAFTYGTWSERFALKILPFWFWSAPARYDHGGSS
jgi:hypothetical protein